MELILVERTADGILFHTAEQGKIVHRQLMHAQVGQIMQQALHKQPGWMVRP